MASRQKGGGRARTCVMYSEVMRALSTPSGFRLRIAITCSKTGGAMQTGMSTSNATTAESRQTPAQMAEGPPNGMATATPPSVRPVRMPPPILPTDATSAGPGSCRSNKNTRLGTIGAAKPARRRTASSPTTTVSGRPEIAKSALAEKAMVLKIMTRINTVRAPTLADSVPHSR